MLTRIKVFALSSVFLLNTFGVLQAHSLYILPAGNDFQPAQPLLSLANNNRKILSTNSKRAPFSTVKLGSTSPSRTPFGKGGSSKANAPREISSTRRKRPAHTQVPRKTGRDGRSVQKALLAANAKRKLLALQTMYLNRTGKRLIVTSFGRTPAKQAKAIRNNLRRYGVRYVLAVYHRSPAIREIVATHRANRRTPRKALREMTRVIQAQVARGVNISDHMLGRAVDIRSRGRNGARLLVLRQIARSIGARVLVEKNHYHVKLV